MIVSLLSTNPSATQSQVPGNGRIVAMSMANGKIVWSHPVPPGSEASPLVWKGLVFFGD